MDINNSDSQPGCQPYRLNGWVVSPFSQKTLAYLRYKGIPHQQQTPGVWRLMRTIQQQVGKAIMPTVETPGGDWLQDSSEIIDYFEQAYPEHSIEPQTPKQQLVAHLLELHADEWLVMASLWYRWKVPQNRDFIIAEFGRYALPGMPVFIRNLMANSIRRTMMGYLPRFGINDKTQQGVQKYCKQLLALLEDHFTQNKYFLGNRPCIGDFSFFGQLYAHLYRDQGSQHLFDNTPALRDWINRLLLADGQEANPADNPQYRFLPDDEIPNTLLPILELIFSEQMPFIATVVDNINQYVANHPDSQRVSRIVGEGDFSIGGAKGQRQQFSFVQWKLQRCTRVWQQLDDQQKIPLEQWLHDIGGEQLLAIDIRHPLKRQNFSEVLA